MDTVRLFSFLLLIFETLLFVSSIVHKCPVVTIKRGKVRIKNKGRIARFVCTEGYQLVGEKAILCIQGKWDEPPPICIRAGCYPRATSVENAMVYESYRGALAKFTCYPGYTISGPSILSCDGRYWNGSLPSCWKTINDLAVKPCDFETDLCGWDNDKNDDFDWKLHSLTTPSGQVGTGPAYDHTLGFGKEGHYLYLETSSPRHENDTATLISPYFPAIEEANKTVCFVFWYHMYGATTGSLYVYVRNELVFSEFGNHGNRWIKGIVPITGESFYQIKIVGTRGPGYVGDIAIDDFKLAEGSDCSYNSSDEEPTPPLGSCLGRCYDNTTSDVNSCYCHDSCHVNSTCCEDFLAVCGLGNHASHVTESGNVLRPASIVGVLLLLAFCGTVAAAFLFIHKWRIRRERGSDEDSDVQYLTSDEFINFNLASPERSVGTDVSESQR